VAAAVAESPCWSVVVPVKPVRVAKSRLLGLPEPVREDLVVAMAVDTVAAALGCPLVAAVYVVTDDELTATAVRACGATPVADEPASGLNPALAHGAAVASRERPECGVAALAADLPALRSAELAVALVAAGRHRRALVSDTDGSGTTMLAAAAGVPLGPAYGADSARLHLAGGAVEVALTGCEGLRRDVDTMEDLATAERLGVGRHTQALLAGAATGMTARPSGTSATVRGSTRC
jgi:2-phospho-L-lactate guanylyltransferase